MPPAQNNSHAQVEPFAVAYLLPFTMHILEQRCRDFAGATQESCLRRCVQKCSRKAAATKQRQEVSSYPDYPVTQICPFHNCLRDSCSWTHSLTSFEHLLLKVLLKVLRLVSVYGLLSEASQTQPAPRTLLRVLKKLNTNYKGETQKN